MADEKTPQKDQSRYNSYKDTVILPKTDFPMKGNLPVTEPQTLERWEKSGLYQKIIAKNAKSKAFVMPDGPPYANGIQDTLPILV